MGPSVVIAVLRRPRSTFKKKQQYETLRLERYRGGEQNHCRNQMVSENSIDRLLLLVKNARDSVRATFRALLLKLADYSNKACGP